MSDSTKAQNAAARALRDDQRMRESERRVKEQRDRDVALGAKIQRLRALRLSKEQ
ncbi:hypothetical protein NK718_03820 [Alsobacter sp. SYSU M60028]|uniref:Uncharacterized protein n=1 Tax=Alsobacter ponti TaxID=2962936 RepID=A0ABT1L961_9HYPH|nr:hypothetical protein [Alsobacter ponti]MCP8937631.1 hypothetical protein [Alsobacter ponti]